MHHCSSSESFKSPTIDSNVLTTVIGVLWEYGKDIQLVIKKKKKLLLFAFLDGHIEMWDGRLKGYVLAVIH